MPKPTPSAPPPTKPAPADAIARLAATLDPDFPAAIVPPAPADIGEPSKWYDGKFKPDFVLADDEGWR